jgi:hypothetical protein
MKADSSKAIYFLRSADVAIDSRLRRYQLALERTGQRFRSIYWHRGAPEKNSQISSTIRYVTNTGFGQRQATMFAFALFNLFILRNLWRNRRDIDAVHAVDLDTVLPAALFCRISGIPLIYDLYDSFIDSRSITGVLRAVFDRMERWAIGQARLVIIADPSRLEQHPPISDAKLLVIENVPVVQELSKIDKSQRADGYLRLGYMGTLEAYGRGLEDVCAAVKRLPFATFDVVGAGALEQRMIARAAACSRITFHGPKEHAEGMRIIGETDILVGLYYALVPNHAFAAPNKYYEHLLLGMPMLTSKNTPPGAKVLANKTGWAVDDNEASIAAALTEAHEHPELIATYGTRAKKLWQRNYADYFKHHILGTYCERVALLNANRDQDLG